MNRRSILKARLITMTSTVKAGRQIRTTERGKTMSHYTTVSVPPDTRRRALRPSRGPVWRLVMIAAPLASKPFWVYVLDMDDRAERSASLLGVQFGLLRRSSDGGLSHSRIVLSTEEIKFSWPAADI